MTAFFLLILGLFTSCSFFYLISLILFIFLMQFSVQEISLYIEQEILQCALIYLFTFTCFAFTADIDSLWFFYQSLSTLLHLCASSQRRRSIDSSSSFMAIWAIVTSLSYCSVFLFKSNNHGNKPIKTSLLLGIGCNHNNEPRLI